jgi:hypothetical protein
MRGLVEQRPICQIIVIGPLNALSTRLGTNVRSGAVDDQTSGQTFPGTNIDFVFWLSDGAAVNKKPAHRVVSIEANASDGLAVGRATEGSTQPQECRRNATMSKSR